jgi:hypothetical protein
MNQQLYTQTGKQRFNQKTGFLSGGRFKKFFTGLFLLFVGVNLLVVIVAKLFCTLGQ